MGRFKLERSTQQSDRWVLTDTENMIVCRFREHQFNETQLFTVLEQLSQQQILQIPPRFFFGVKWGCFDFFLGCFDFFLGCFDFFLG